jgi:hypothetical protein
LAALALAALALAVLALAVLAWLGRPHGPHPLRRRLAPGK